MTNSKKIVMAGMIALQSMNALASSNNKISIEEFKTPVAEYTQQAENETHFPNIEMEDGKVYLEHLNSGVKVTEEEVLSLAISGAYKHPFKEDQIMVISFQDRKDFEKQHKKIQNSLKEAEKFNQSKYYNYKDEERSAKILENGSFQKTNVTKGVDYNFISISHKQINQLVQIAIKEGYDKDVVAMIPEFIFYHELAHSHDHQAEGYRELKEAYQNLEEQEIKKNQHKVDKKLELLYLGGENYADSNALLMLSKKYSQQEGGKEKLEKFEDYLLESFRDDSKLLKKFDVHMTKASVKVTMDFIRNNENLIDQFTTFELEQVAASITNGVVNHKDVNTEINNHISQKSLQRSGGFSNRELRKISEDINEQMTKMVNVNIDKKGNKILDFNYQPNVHTGQKYSRIKLK